MGFERYLNEPKHEKEGGMKEDEQSASSEVNKYQKYMRETARALRPSMFLVVQKGKLRIAVREV